MAAATNERPRIIIILGTDILAAREIAAETIPDNAMRIAQQLGFSLLHITNQYAMKGIITDGAM